MKFILYLNEIHLIYCIYIKIVNLKLKYFSMNIIDFPLINEKKINGLN
jgi:hypothetical protein